jgi:hypothetical protein
MTTRLTIRPTEPASRIVEYDSIRRRLWILGQRCHHGATGSVVAALACAGLVAKPLVLESQPAIPPLMVLAAAGGALMAHDWKDHSIWFERGYGSQP